MSWTVRKTKKFTHNAQLYCDELKGNPTEEDNLVAGLPDRAGSYVPLPESGMSSHFFICSYTTKEMDTAGTTAATQTGICNE